MYNIYTYIHYILHIHFVTSVHLHLILLCPAIQYIQSNKKTLRWSKFEISWSKDFRCSIFSSGIKCISISFWSSEFFAMGMLMWWSQSRREWSTLFSPLERNKQHVYQISIYRHGFISPAQKLWVEVKVCCSTKKMEKERGNQKDQMNKVWFYFFSPFVWDWKRNP